MNIIFDENKSIRFDSLEVGESFVVCDAVVYDGDKVTKYSNRTYCKLNEFFNDFAEKCNAISVSDKYYVYIQSCSKVIRVDANYRHTGDVNDIFKQGKGL